jgi:hypothetical protein
MGKQKSQQKKAINKQQHRPDCFRYRIMLGWVAALKLMSYMSAGDSPLNKVITSFSPPFKLLQLRHILLSNSLGDLKSSII